MRVLVIEDEDAIADFILRGLREDRGLTRYSLAQLAGLSTQVVYDLESGRRLDPRWSTVQSLARALGVSTEALRDS